MSLERKTFSAMAILAICITLAACASKDEWKSRTVYQILTDRIWKTDGSTQPCANLGDYCGGTWAGLTDQLDYIKGMGFDAIWVSPIVENTPGCYHGYCLKNLYTVNLNFGSEADLKTLITEMHKRDMWIMVDVVANHVGPVNFDFSQIYPFNQDQHYHPFCNINPEDWSGNQWRVEHCRLANLPDLDQDNQFVHDTLIAWIKDLVQKWGIDGLRVDTVPEVAHDFWTEFSQSAGVFTIGEVYNGDVNYVGGYQGNLDATLGYPMYFTLTDVYAYGHSAFEIRAQWDAMTPAFKDLDVLGNFVDNHDQPRFLNRNGEVNTLKNALAFILFARGLPIVYYGTEQGFNGGADPANREPLWTNINPQSDLYIFLQTAINVRKKYQVWSLDYTERYVDDNFYAFSRGKVFIATTNSQAAETTHSVPYNPYSVGDVVCNIFWQGDCVTVTANGLPVDLDNGETKIYIPKDDLRTLTN